MKSLSAAVCLWLMSTLSLVSQQDLSVEEIVSYQNKAMAKLEMTPKQTEQVSAINLTYATKQMALMDEEGSMFGKFGRMKKLGKAKNAELEKVLTEEQYERYEDDIEPQIRKHFRAKMQQK